MARLPRLCLPNIPQHIIQRGNNRRACFGSEDDFAAYAHWLEEYAKKYRMAIHGWVFMTNHVHLLVTPETSAGVSQLMQALGRHYVRHFNYTYRRTGTLWEGRFKSCVVSAEQYFLSCLPYIELNPVRAGMVEHPAGYRWSSFHANGLGRRVKLWTPHEVYQRLGSTLKARAEAYRNLFTTQQDMHEMNELRTALNKGMALGNDRFKQEIEALTGRRVTPEKRGPKPRR
ncbi:transposase [Simiduia curdlanivorans]|uniref:Transposase n=1 Tax=Simiduia curdlanivorans TaxID=1492769 RepID=A0ABV8V123_9GAMM|nr:transposase [Simiduia curdlanivorans]MDN3637572.1 transposase [Simiduia curdlanivorans]